MTDALTLVRRALQLLRRDERGAAVTLEYILFLPVLLFTLTGGYFLFDAYRERMLAQKAAFTLSDLVSRETMEVTNEYLDSMYTLMDYITRTARPEGMRMDVVQWDAETSSFSLTCTVTRGSGLDPLTNADVEDYDERLPALADAESLVIINTRFRYTLYDYLLNQELVLKDFVFVRPRFAPTVTCDSNANELANEGGTDSSAEGAEF